MIRPYAAPTRPRGPALSRDLPGAVSASPEEPTRTPEASSSGLEIIIPSQSWNSAIGASFLSENRNEEEGLWKLARKGPSPEKEPPLRQVLVLSQPLDPAVYEYTLQLLAGIPASQARDRFVLSLGDDSKQSLSDKLLARPETMAWLRELADGVDGVPTVDSYMGTPAEGALTDILGAELRASPPDLQYWGTKPGSRELFREADVPFPPGSGQVHSTDQLAEALRDLIEAQPLAKRWAVKLSEGAGGVGNALLDVDGLAPRTHELGAALPARFKFHEQFDWPQFEAQIRQQGAIVELFLEGEGKTSPSVQGIIHPGGRVEILSTHDQVLGGENEQDYQGVHFPARADYRVRLQEEGLKIGRCLARKGARGRFAIDFVGIPEGGKEKRGWALFAIEVNLRESCTTHPYEMMRLLTGGSFEPTSGAFRTASGEERHYFSTYDVAGNDLRGLMPADAIDIVHRHGLHYDPDRQVGVVFHSLGLLRDKGELGVSYIAPSREGAEALCRALEEAFAAERAHVPSRSSHRAVEAEPLAGTIAAGRPLFLLGGRQVLLKTEEGRPTDLARTAAFSADGRRIATAVNLRDHSSVQVHDAVSGRRQLLLDGPYHPIRAVALETREPLPQVVAADASGALWSWDATFGALRWRLPEGPMVNAIQISSDGSRLVAADAAGRVRLLDSGTGQTLRAWSEPAGWARSAAFSPDGASVAAAFDDGSAVRWDVETGRELGRLEDHPGGAMHLAFSPDGKRLAVTSGDGPVTIWNLQSEEALLRLSLPEGTGPACFSSDGKRLAATSSDGVVRLFEVTDGTELKARGFDGAPALLSHEAPLGAIHFGRQGRSLSSLSAYGGLYEWSFAAPPPDA